MLKPKQRFITWPHEHGVAWKLSRLGRSPSSGVSFMSCAEAPVRKSKYWMAVLYTSQLAWPP